MKQKIKTWQIPHKNESFNSYDNIYFGLLVPRIVMRVRGEKEVMPILLNLAYQYGSIERKTAVWKWFYRTKY